MTDHYDVDLLAPLDSQPCAVEPPDGYCMRPGSPGDVLEPDLGPRLDHYVGCLSLNAPFPGDDRVRELLSALHDAPASEAGGPVRDMLRQLLQQQEYPISDGSAVALFEVTRFLADIQAACVAHSVGVLRVYSSTNQTDSLDRKQDRS